WPRPARQPRSLPLRFCVGVRPPRRGQSLGHHFATLTEVLRTGRPGGRRLNALQQQWQGNNRRQALERRPLRLSLRDKIDVPRPTLAADGRRTTVDRLRGKWAVSERREHTTCRRSSSSAARSPTTPSTSWPSRWSGTPSGGWRRAAATKIG